MNFFEEIVKEIINSMFNDYDDNWDYIRYGHDSMPPKKRIRAKIQKLLNKRGYYHVFTIQELIIHSQWIKKFEYLYNSMPAQEDKKLLLKVIAYRVLGHRKVKLPLNTAHYWDKMKFLESLCNKSDSIDPHFLHFILYRVNLNIINYPIEFYFTPGGIYSDFIIKQYEYKKKEVLIKAEVADVVIDGGGCWGDTALYFSHEVGSKGKVFSFEFIPDNIAIFEKNILLNDNLKNIIELVKRPLWENSTTKLYFKDNGPGSNVSTESFKGSAGECLTLSIDDLVVQRGLEKIDFVKLDIEGAEMNALKGASKTIKKFRPKLAIALYHSVEDFERIPILLRELVPEYELYFSHCSINAEESILFAKVKK